MPNKYDENDKLYGDIKRNEECSECGTETTMLIEVDGDKLCAECIEGE